MNEGPSELEIIATTRYAAVVLSHLFNIRRRLEIVPKKRERSHYTAEFFHLDNTIYLDIPSILRMDDLETIHTLGEEVGHNLHFYLNPQVFRNSDPTPEKIIEAIKTNQYQDLVGDTVDASNIVEFVGFYAGLCFLTERYDRSIARSFAAEIINFYAEFRPELLPEAIKLISYNAVAIQETYKNSPEAVERQIRDDTPSPKLEKIISPIKHGFGYALASRVFLGPSDVPYRSFEIAITGMKFSELYKTLIKNGYVPLEK